MGDEAVQKHYIMLWLYIVAHFSAEEAEAKYRCTKEAASKLMRPGGPLSHLKKEDVTWEQVQDARAKRAREKHAGADEQPHMLPAAMTGDASGVSEAAAAAGPCDNMQLDQEVLPAGPPAGPRLPAAGAMAHQQGAAPIGGDHSGTSGHHGDNVEQQLGQQQKKRRIELTISDPVTPEELNRLTSQLVNHPQLLNNQPLHRQRLETLQAIFNAITAKAAWLKEERGKLSKAGLVYAEKVADFSSAASQMLKEVREVLVAKLAQDEIGKNFLDVTDNRLEQVLKEVEDLARELNSSAEQLKRDKQVARLNLQVRNMQDCAKTVKEFINAQCGDDDSDDAPAGPSCRALQIVPVTAHAKQPPISAAETAKEEEASQATAMTGATGTSGGGLRGLIHGLMNRW